MSFVVLLIRRAVGMLMLAWSLGAAAQQATGVAPTAAQSPPAAANVESHFDVSDAAREATRIARYQLDLKIDEVHASLEAKAVVTVANQGASPMTAIPLQISSTLKWETVNEDGKPLRFAHHVLPSDADHTGEVNEALITLPSPIAPGEQQQLTIFYGGTVEPSASRLSRIGTPGELAHATDWDGIRPGFTGLRGFGNVLWLPVSAPPVLLGQGDRLFREIGRQNQRGFDTSVTITVTEEFSGAAPSIAFLDACKVPVRIVAQPAGDLPGIATASLPETKLGFASPSVFLAARSEQSGDHVAVYTREEDAAAPQAYLTAASIVAPQMTQWLGSTPKRSLSILDLPDGSNRPAEQEALWLTALNSVDPKRLLTPMSHALAHAWFASPRPWLSEGVAQFMEALWTEHQSGRAAAMEQLDSQRSALSLAESADPDREPGEPLTRAQDPIFYRTKANYVFWMLRGIVGDTALAAALRQYDAAQDTTPAYFQHLLERTSGQPLDWFFADWVNGDRGLPDLAIGNVTPSQGSGEDTYIVAVTVANEGTAVADVPVTVSSAEATVTERLRVPPKGRATKRLLSHGYPRQVQVNDGTTPEVQASVHRRDIVRTPAP